MAVVFALIALIIFPAILGARSRERPVIYDGGYRRFRMDRLKRGDAVICADLEEFVRLRYEMAESGIGTAWSDSDIEGQRYVLYVRCVDGRGSETDKEEEE